MCTCRYKYINIHTRIYTYIHTDEAKRAFSRGEVDMKKEIALLFQAVTEGESILSKRKEMVRNV